VRGGRDPEPTELIEQQRQEIARLREDLARSEAARKRIERERARLEREITQLKDELEAARRTGAQQAAPFSKGTPKRRPRRPGRKPAARYGRRGQRPIPPVVHETHDVPLPAECPTCGEAVTDTQVVAQYQEDLPPVQAVVRRFDIHVGLCGRGHRVQGRHRLQTSVAAVGPARRTLRVPAAEALRAERA
jgi:transposase